MKLRALAASAALALAMSTVPALTMTPAFADDAPAAGTPAAGTPAASTASDTPSPDPARVEELTTKLLDVGHVDAFAFVKNGSGVSLVLKEDVTVPGHSMYRNPARVILGVKEAAYQEASAKVPEIGTAGYSLPINQDFNLLWPGWTSELIAPLNPATITINFDKVTGPGDVYLFTSGLTGIKPLLASGSMKLTSGDKRVQTFAAHEHANWLFTKPGDYTFTVTGKVALKDGSALTTNTATYRWAVGRDALAKAREEIKGGSTSEPGSSTASDKEPAAPGTADGANGAGNGGSNASGDAANGAANGAANAANAPAATPTPEKCVATEEYTEVPKPQTTTRTTTRVGGAYTIPANTHVHPNWVFTAPGTYKVVIEQQARAKNGRIISASTPLTFIVGGSGNANSGHFDIGASSNGSSLTAVVKDDRQSPARWVAPSALTFGVGNAGRTTAPAGIEFIAAPGQTIWTISSSQVAGVPWVGANTQHPDLLANTTGDVRWKLVSVSGPGALAVFESGNFGKVLGRYWFGGAVTSTSGGATNGAVIEKNGKYYRVTVVGRTPSGKPCVLDAATVTKYRNAGYTISADSLPSTGASATAPLAAGALAITVGAAAVAISRRKKAAA